MLCGGEEVSTEKNVTDVVASVDSAALLKDKLQVISSPLIDLWVILDVGKEEGGTRRSSEMSCILRKLGRDR